MWLCCFKSLLVQFTKKTIPRYVLIKSLQVIPPACAHRGSTFFGSTAGRGEGLRRFAGLYTRRVWNIQPPCAAAATISLSLCGALTMGELQGLCVQSAHAHKPLLCRSRVSEWVSESEILRRSREYNNDADADKKENTCNIYSARGTERAAGWRGLCPRSFQIVVYPWA